MKKINVDKFRTIPFCPYSVDITWDYLEFNLKHYIDKYDLELNPNFQRGHVWTTKQQREYIEFILKGGESGKDIYFNCKGWMGLEETGPFVLVDGLQRVTAVRKFMNNKMEVFGGLKKENFLFIGMEFRFKFHINNYDNMNDVYVWYIEMNSGGVIHSDKQIQKVKDMIQ